MPGFLCTRWGSKPRSLCFHGSTLPTEPSSQIPTSLSSTDVISLAPYSVQVLRCLGHLTPPFPPLNVLLTLTKTASLEAVGPYQSLFRCPRHVLSSPELQACCFRKPHLAVTDLSTSTSYFATHISIPSQGCLVISQSHLQLFCRPTLAKPPFFVFLFLCPGPTSLP